MALPLPFAKVLHTWKQQGYELEAADWTTRLHRHVGVVLRKESRRFFAKMSFADAPDLDEPRMVDGYGREIWWSDLIAALRRQSPSFPFQAPRVVATNVRDGKTRDEVAWIILEFVEATPLIDWEPEFDRDVRDLPPDWKQSFEEFLHAIFAALAALQRVTPRVVVRLGCPVAPPFLPHDNRGFWDFFVRRLPIPRLWKDWVSWLLERRARKCLAQSDRILGNGAFELKCFFRGPDGTFYILDNEFAGWYPPTDHLTYFLHRLWANQQCPQLARYALRRYVDAYVLPRKRGRFFTDFARTMFPRLLTGWFYDSVRRRFPPWHPKQRLRYGLIGALFRRDQRYFWGD